LSDIAFPVIPISDGSLTISSAYYSLAPVKPSFMMIKEGSFD
jgi:hypothetical protein